MPKPTLSISDDVLIRLTEEARRHGLGSAEELVIEFVNLGLQDCNSGALDDAAIEDELLRRIKSEDWVATDEADFRSIREEIEAKLLNRQNS